MYKVLLVDDELLVIQGIKNKIDWEGLGIEVCGVANDGLQAFTMIMNDPPDIVITDINMPVMDGLALIKKIKEQQLVCEIIVLSGYSEFEYARKSLQYGVNEYLLKPCTAKNIKNALQKTIEKIETSNRVLQTMENLEIIQANAKQLLMSNLLLYILMETSMDTEGSIKSLVKSYPRLENSKYAVSIIAIHTTNKAKNIGELEVFSIANICNEILCSQDAGFSVKFNNTSLVALSTYGKEDKEYLSKTKITFESIIKAVQNYIEIPVSIYVGGFMESPYNIVKSFEQAQLCMQNKMFVDNPNLLIYDKQTEDLSEADSGNIIRFVMEYVGKNYASPITLSDIAKELFLTPNYLTTLFKKKTGTAFKKYLTHYRIHQAKKYLAEPKYRVIDIAKFVGYENDEYFCKVFKGVEGCTPSEYRISVEKTLRKEKGV